MVTVARVASPLVAVDDPIESLKGYDPMEAIDIATLETNLPPNIAVETLPLSLRGPIPTLGEPVLALGYPFLTAETRRPDTSIVTLSEEMRGGFGRIMGFFPWGRGRRNPTPVYQVEANWASGMSGAPVLNKAGEVIGVVSHSMLSDDIGARNGVGYVAAFAFMTNITESLNIDSSRLL